MVVAACQRVPRQPAGGGRAPWAVSQHIPGTDRVAHSDRGVQSASEQDQRGLSEHDLTGSMSRRGDGCDHAPLESFFATRES